MLYNTVLTNQQRAVIQAPPLVPVLVPVLSWCFAKLFFFFCYLTILCMERLTSLGTVFIYYVVYILGALFDGDFFVYQNMLP